VHRRRTGKQQRGRGHRPAHCTRTRAF
jgi:hypothetical protein